MVLPLARGLSNETGHSLLWNRAQEVVVENNLHASDKVKE